MLHCHYFRKLTVLKQYSHDLPEIMYVGSITYQNDVNNVTNITK